METGIPHYLYYEAAGCSMEAIDLLPPPENARILQGDARLLKFADSSFDFLTCATILGPPHVCGSAGEIAFTVGEFTRVLRPGGFVYLADASIQPTVIYAAQCFGLDSCYSKGAGGLPIGTFLWKCSAGGRSWPQGLFDMLTQITLVGSGDLVVRNANLLWDEGEPEWRSGDNRRFLTASPRSSSKRAL